MLERLPAYKVQPAPESPPGRWQTGTSSFEAIAGVLAAVDYLAGHRRGPADGPSRDRRGALIAAFTAIRRHEKALAAHFLEKLAGLPDYRVWGVTNPARLDERVPTFGLTHRRRTPLELAQALAENGFFTWHGHFYAVRLIEALGLAPTGVLRVGFLHYNTHDEVDRLLELLATLGG